MVVAFGATDARAGVPSDDGDCRSFPVSVGRSLDRSAALQSCRSRGAGSVRTADLDAEVAASLLIAAADGLQIQWLLDPDSVDMGARLEQMLHALVGAATTGRARPAEGTS